MSILNIVDENGNIIGEDTRENIHKNGFLHREIHIFFYTPDKEIIFQLRDKNKDTFPNLLDATVGGHVELNSGFIDTALKEMLEETGIRASANDLHLVDTLHKKAEDRVTGMTNNVIRSIYAFKYIGKIDDLKIENDAAQGFVAWDIDKLVGELTPEDSNKFIPTVLDDDYLEIYKDIKSLIQT